MLTVTRRGLLVLGGTGAAGVALAGCGEATDPRDDSSPEDLTNAEAEAEGNLSRAYVTASQTATGRQRTTLEGFAEAAKRRFAEIAGGTYENTSPEADGGPDAAEALSACQHLANATIAAHLQAAGLLDEVEGRALASSSLAAVAAELAVVNVFADEPVAAPNAFVTGGAEKPLESADEPDTGDSSTTSSTTPSSTTSEADTTTKP